MKELFVGYEQAKKLKSLGFDGECLGWYNYGTLTMFGEDSLLDGYAEEVYERPLAPLYQQAFDWFLSKYNLFVKIDFFSSDEFEGLDYDYSIFNLSKPFKEDGITDNPIVDYSVNETYYFSYKEAREAALNELIEIVENESV